MVAKCNASFFVDEVQMQFESQSLFAPNHLNNREALMKAVYSDLKYCNFFGKRSDLTPNLLIASKDYSMKK